MNAPMNAPMSALAAEHGEFRLLSSTFEPPNIRARLHAICALYAYTPVQNRRMELLDTLEELTLQVAHLLAVDLLENGWRPDPV